MPSYFIGQRGGGVEIKTIILQISPGMANVRRGGVNLFRQSDRVP